MGGRIESSNPFSLLADETRLGVIEAIGDASGDGEYACLPYSVIKTALGGHDTGNLNYHLRRLKSRFVERTDDGYRLTVPGIRVYQAISSGQFDDDRPTVSPTPVDENCEVCDGTVVVSYEDHRFFVRCSDCDVLYHRYPLSPNAFDPDDPESLLVAGMTKAHTDLRSMLAGICPYCSGRVERTLSAEDRGETNHDEWEMFAHLCCTRCGWYSHPPLLVAVYHHPATAVFYEERGVSDHYVEVDAGGQWEWAVRSEDPLRVRIDVEYEGDVVRYLVDQDLTVLDWEVLA